MKNTENEHVLQIWKKLCSYFEKRSMLLPRKYEFKLSWLGLRIDQITLHQNSNVSWKEAMDLLHRQPTNILKSLEKLSINNLELQSSMLNFRIWFLTTMAGILGLFGLIDSHYHSNRLDLFVYGYFGTIFTIYMLILLKTWHAKQLVLELSSCVQTVVTTRKLKDSSDR